MPEGGPHNNVKECLPVSGSESRGRVFRAYLPVEWLPKRSSLGASPPPISWTSRRVETDGLWMLRGGLSTSWWVVHSQRIIVTDGPANLTGMLAVHSVVLR